LKTITLHKIDKTLDSHIRTRARKERVSLNQTIQNMLAEYTGISKKTKKNDFDEFLGLWNAKEYKEFKKITSVFGKINKSDWE